MMQKPGLLKQDQSGINLSDPSGNLKSLNIFQDDKGILRVGGRLEKASIPYSQKHPAILAKNSKLSKIYFITLHKKLFHVGPQGLLNAVRLRFWALGGRNLARKTVHTCVVCFKCKPIPSSQIMGNLPYERVNMAPPFSITGLDLGDQNLAAYLTEEGIEWNFIPPRAPHMGGLWEVKYHLKRALGRSRLTYEEFETVIIQRGKWMIEKDNVMCGTMVIVKEDFTPVCNWLLGRVVEVYHGSDATRGLLATDHVIVIHGQVTWTTPELAPPSPNYHTTPMGGRFTLDRFNVHRCPTLRVFSGTGLELVTRQATIRYLYHSATAA
ncbi:integrase catalytic domain-containing protein [Trichonephila clavipes]|nr:integrase catalytic domain-containing protein [Trichonephila clavipes]